MNSEVILEISGLYKAFPGSRVSNSSGQDDHCILRGLDLSVYKGSITAVIGGNGAGKSTLFNIVSGFVIPERGTISLIQNGQKLPLIGRPPYEITRLGIGRLFQDAHIFSQMTVLENMLVADKNAAGERLLDLLIRPGRVADIEHQREERAEQIFEMLFGTNNSFWAKRREKAENLSHGQQRLLGLARLFMGDYSIVLLDEPTAGVNPQTIEQIMLLIRQLRSYVGVTILLIEHNMHVVLNSADFCYFMDGGKIASFGTPADVLSDPEVRDAYLGS